MRSGEGERKRMVGVGRFFQSYYIVNLLSIASYVAIRWRWLQAGSLERKDEWFGVTRETELWVTLSLLGLGRYRTAATLEQFLSTMLWYLKGALLISAFLLDSVTFVWYSILFVFLAVVLPYPTFSWNGVEELSPASLEAYRSESAKTPSLLLCIYSPWDLTCNTFIPTFVSIAREVASENLKVARLNGEKWPDTCSELNVDSSNLSLVFFKAGKLCKAFPEKDPSTGEAPYALIDRNLVQELLKA